MREIKVRVWDKERKKMYYQLKKSPCFGLFEGDRAVSVEDVFFYETQLFVKMQYTGLTDKNGREIYEGDIVRHATDEGIYKVVFEDGGFYIKNLFEYDFQTIDEYPLEIIGNIYENPELLEGEKDGEMYSV